MTKLDEQSATVAKSDLNKLHDYIEDAERAKAALEAERRAYDQLTAARTRLDAERDAEVSALKESLRAAKRQTRNETGLHLAAFAEGYKSQEYDSDFRVGLRLEWRFF